LQWLSPSAPAVALLPYKPGLAVNDERMTSSVQAVANVTNTKDQIDRPLLVITASSSENPLISAVFDDCNSFVGNYKVTEPLKTGRFWIGESPGGPRKKEPG
jgi:hypothetical protein